MSINMRVVCVKKRDHETRFKIGDVYNMVEKISHFPYRIYNLNGEHLATLCGLDYRLFFIPLEEHRMNQLNIVLNG